MANVFIDENTLIAIADAIRAKTGNTDKMLPKDMSVAIDGITAGGGGSSNDVRYVTFMNGNTVLYVKPVAVGDDCVNVLTKGFIETPTKESTVDTVYTYSGWSLTDGGSTDTNALANVAEDRTVYASYTESVRYYTVNFYDGETLLKTEQIPYGGSSTYTYAKDNHVFNGWNPEPTNITGDLDCYGVWEESYSFADASWEYIARVSESGKASEVFALGDTRTETLTYADGTTEDVELMIASFDLHPDTNGKPTITIINNNLLHKCGLVEYCNYASNVTGQLLGYQSVYCDILKPFMNDTIIPAFSTELQSVLRECELGVGSWNSCICKIAPPTCENVGINYSGVAGVYQKTLYSFTANNASRKRTIPDGLPENANGYGYWLYDYTSAKSYNLQAGSIDASTGVYKHRSYNNGNLVMFKIFV